MTRFAVRLLLILMLVRPATAQASDTWQPAGKWNLDLGEGACTLGRAFTAGEHKLVLGFHTRPPGDRVWLILVAPSGLFSGAADRLTPVTITASGMPPIAGDLSVDWDVGVDSKRVRISIDRLALGGLIAAKSISVDGAGERLTIETTSAPGAAEFIQRCEEDLYRRWKMDPHQWDTLATFPRGTDMTGKVSVDDYPQRALFEQQEGRTSVLLRVDDKGKVHACRVIASSSVQRLDTKTCEIMRFRATFIPATDKSGRAVPTWMRAEFTWRLPRD